MKPISQAVLPKMESISHWEWGIKAVVYGILAEYYDELMSEVNYQQWFSGLTQLCRGHGRPIEPGSIVLDLACGTGMMTLQLAKAGCRVIGVDLSPEMLAVADQRLREAGFPVTFLQQDMRYCRLGELFDHVFCLCDSLNYLTDEEDLHQCFSSVGKLLRPGGLFVFDVNTEYKLSTVYGNKTYAERLERFSYIWENTYDPDEGLCQMDLAFYVKEADGRFAEYTETHYERVFSDNQVRRALSLAGMELLGSYGDDLKDPPQPQTERITYVARPALAVSGVLNNGGEDPNGPTV